MCDNLRFTPFLKQCYVTAAVDLTTVGLGSTLGYPAILLPQLREPDSTVTLSEEAESWIASVYALGMLAGYFITPPMMDRLGRKKAHYFVTVITIVGWLLTILATDVTALVIGRILHGVAGGVMAPLGTVLVGECSSPTYRGAFITTLTLSQSMGILLVHFLGSLLSWQQTALVFVFFPLASLIMSIYTPESPSWLLANGKNDKFQKVFRWFRGDGEEEELTSMLRARTTAMGAEKDTSKSFGSFILEKEFFKPIIIMIHSNVLLQFAGGTILVAYSPIIVGLMMGPTASVYLWTVFMDIWRIFANIVAVFVIHRFRRRTMILSSTGLCILCHVAIIIYLYGYSEGWFVKPWIPVAFLSLQLFSNAVGVVPIRNVLSGELFPLRYRSIGGSISFASGSVFMFIVLKTFPTLVDKFQFYGTYAMYGSILVYIWIVIWFILPETKGRTLQQIEDGFKGKQNSADVATIELNVKSESCNGDKGET